MSSQGGTGPTKVRPTSGKVELIPGKFESGQP